MSLRPVTPAGSLGAGRAAGMIFSALSAIARPTDCFIRTTEGLPLVVFCQFYPTSYTISKSNTWSAPVTTAQGVQQPPEFTKHGIGTLNGLKLWFDTYDSQIPVTVHTNRLRSMMEPAITVKSKEAIFEKRKRPPYVRFTWGLNLGFEAVITSLSEEFKLFLANGLPVRSLVTVSLMEVPAPAFFQNPTSRAAGSRKIYVVQMGDTIDWIAETQLGDAGEWRALASYNQIDDPRRLRPGMRLYIP